MKAVLVSLVAVLVFASFTLASDLGGYTFLKISGPDNRAVVKMPEGEVSLVAVGDMLNTAKIVEIADDRVVLEQASENGPTMLLVTIKDGRQQIRRIQKMPVKENAISIEPGTASKRFGQ